MSQSIYLFATDAYLLTLDVLAFALFLHYIYQHRAEGYTWLRPAIALLVLWFGDAVLRGPNWYARLLISIGVQVDQPDTWMIIGGSIKAIAYLCIIKVFSPTRWGRKSWVIAFLLATLFTAMSLSFTYWENHQ